MEQQNKKNVSDLTGTKRDELKFDDEVKGINLENDVTIDDLLLSYKNTGFQALNLYKGIQEIKRMRKANAKVFFGATSNITSCGLREVVCYMAKNKYFDVYVTPGGGIEEDIIKCFKPTKLGCFKLDGKELRENGWNRIGNLVINNENYVYYEQFIVELLNELIDGYTPENPRIITPSEFISLLGKKINNENSVLYWCYKNNINVYCPAITDGSTGDIITFFNKRDCLKIDIVQDIYNINCECMNLKRELLDIPNAEKKNGVIVIGSGIVKHHILNGNLFNDGLDYCVILNTAHEEDGSDAGASLQEAFSWGKVKPSKTCVKISGEASIILPLLIYGGFKSNSNFE